MFHASTDFYYIYEGSIWKFEGVTDISNLFKECNKLEKIPSFLSKLDISKVIDKREVFADCIALKEIPDISNWDTSNVIDFTGFFGGLLLITELPYISKWNLSHAKIFHIFLKIVKK